MGTSPLELGIGFGTNFFDTLGIGSFAPTTSLFKLKHVVPDERIPGTLHVGHTPPVIIQAFIFIAIISVDVITLAALIAAATLGAWLGAGVVARWPRRRIQIGMGIALLIAAATFDLQQAGCQSRRQFVSNHQSGLFPGLFNASTSKLAMVNCKV